MPSAKVTSKGQITIPIEVRRALGLKAGVRIDFHETGDGEFTLRAKTGSIKEMRGCLPRIDPPPTVEDMNRAILDHAANLDRATKTRSENANEGEAA